MSHSSVLNTKHSPKNMKIKVGAAFTAVVVGHIAVLWALGQMKPHHVKVVKKEPIQAHFVKIQQPPKPQPPKPKEPPKPKKEVKEVKIVKNPPPPPKKVEKVQQVKKAEQPKKEVQQVEKPQPVIVPPVVSTVETKPVPQPDPAPTPTPQPAPAAEPAEKTPKSVSIGGSGVQWSLSPKPSYDQNDLRGSPRSIVVLIEADEKGKIISVTVVKSSGIPALDQKILRAVRGAKFKPYMENGVAYPIKAQQPFDLS